MSEMFKNSGFDVVQSRHNLGIGDMRRALRDFSDEARDADVAIVYYAGHGMEIDGVNYLIPIGFEQPLCGLGVAAQRSSQRATRKSTRAANRSRTSASTSLVPKL